MDRIATKKNASRPPVHANTPGKLSVYNFQVKQYAQDKLTERVRSQNKDFGQPLDMSKAEWDLQNKMQKQFFHVHLNACQKVTKRAESAHLETQRAKMEVTELISEVKQTAENLQNLNDQIDTGLRAMTKEQIGRAYQDLQKHPFGDCFHATGEICLPCKKFNHVYGQCAEVQGIDKVCGPCKLKTHEFGACFKYEKTLCEMCKKKPHPRNACAQYLKTPCQSCRLVAR